MEQIELDKVMEGNQENGGPESSRLNLLKDNNGLVKMDTMQSAKMVSEYFSDS